MALAYTVTETGLAQWIANLIPSGLSLIVLLGLLICLIVFLTELTSNIATTMTFIPIIYAVSIKLGINPLILMLPLTISASCAFMLPVATPPNAIVFSSGVLTIPQMIRAGFMMNIVAMIVLTILAMVAVPAVFG